MSIADACAPLILLAERGYTAAVKGWHRPNIRDEALSAARESIGACISAAVMGNDRGSLEHAQGTQMAGELAVAKMKIRDRLLTQERVPPVSVIVDRTVCVHCRRGVASCARCGGYKYTDRIRDGGEGAD